MGFRATALRALYAAETAGREAPDLDGLDRRARHLVEGVWERREDLDRLLGDLVKGWRIERMAPIDRNVLRIGAYELLRGRPPGVVISEAVELAKRYSTEGSGRFVNGVLGALARRLAVAEDDDGRPR
ncbi:MAG TPA: transcription antitermination factor NusB [Actinobacteria bacterium]|nr:transcription antitermination factor NusB [Actinomycetota bacterium]